MPNIFYSYKVANGEAFFDEHEIRHFKVLKVQKDDKITFTDGKGCLFKGTIKKISSKEAIANVEEVQKIPREVKNKILLCLSSSKWQRERLLIEKAVELGVDCIIEFKSEHSVVHSRKQEKIDLLVRNSMKQSINLFKSDIRIFDNFNDFIAWVGTQNDVCFIVLDRNGEKINNVVLDNDVGLIIGPEGGFSTREMKSLEALNISKVKFGDRILRFETAALVGIVIISYLKGKI